MKKPFARVLIAACLLAGGTVAGDQRWPVREEEAVRETLRFAASESRPRTLHVRVISGSIRVSAHDRPDVELGILKRIAAETEADVADAERDVTFETTDGGSIVQAIVRDRAFGTCGDNNFNGNRSWPRRRYAVTVDLDIRVPADTRLELCTINGGDVRVEGVRGLFDIHNVNGRITMTGATEGGRARTVNGPVNISFASAPTAASEFVTVNGDVVVAVPAPLSADLRMKTFNGGLFTDFDVQMQTPRPEPASRQGGRFVYRSAGFTPVRIGAGGTEMTLQSFNGDVRVVKR